VTDYGLTATGFVPKTFDVIRTEIADAMRAAFGLSIDMGDRSIFGQIVAIISEREAIIWELAEQVYSSQDPDKAAGASLDALCLLTGTFRPGPLASTVTLTLTGTPATPVPAGNKAHALSTGTQVSTDSPGTITLLSSWVNSTTYALNDRVTNGGNTYICTDPGISAISGGPTGTSSSIVDNGVIWRFMGQGTGAVDVPATATTTGPLTLTSGDVTVKDTAVGGWSGVINLADGITGRDLMTDEDLRMLRVEELSSAGKATIDAIEAVLLEITGVTAATIFDNNTDITNSDGVPPHAIECLVRGGADQDIRDALLGEVAAGIATYGNTSGTSTDSQGISHTVKFSRPVEIPIYVDVTLIKNAGTYPADGDAQVKAAIVAWGQKQATGKDAVASAIVAQCFTITGVLDVTNVKIGTSPSPTTGATIAIASRQLATYDTSRITLNTSNGTP